MNPIFAQTSLSNIPWGWVRIGVAVAFLLALGLLLIHFGMIYLRALFSSHPL